MKLKRTKSKSKKFKDWSWLIIVLLVLVIVILIYIGDAGNGCQKDSYIEQYKEKVKKEFDNRTYSYINRSNNFTDLNFNRTFFPSIKHVNYTSFLSDGRLLRNATSLFTIDCSLPKKDKNISIIYGEIINEVEISFIEFCERLRN